MELGRRDLLRTAGAATVGSIAGCSGSESYRNGVYEGRVRSLGEKRITEGYWGVEGETEPLPTYFARDYEPSPLEASDLYLLDPESLLEPLDLDRGEVSGRLKLLTEDMESDR
ncbi:MAG: hypothetical protein SVS85_01975, partial [Candidatus Nanohaloarchaea archaeon]|nr:hypothetical protein [Candidatus Nanohaloarchaea archaeon]